MNTTNKLQNEQEKKHNKTANIIFAILDVLHFIAIVIMIFSFACYAYELGFEQDSPVKAFLMMMCTVVFIRELIKFFSKTNEKIAAKNNIKCREESE